MNEFEIKSFDEAKNCVDEIEKNARNIMQLFDDVDVIMNRLYNNNWSSEGAVSVKENYAKIRNNYDGFFGEILDLKKKIYNSITEKESADRDASNVITNI